MSYIVSSVFALLGMVLVLAGLDMEYATGTEETIAGFAFLLLAMIVMIGAAASTVAAAILRSRSAVPLPPPAPSGPPAA